MTSKTTRYGPGMDHTGTVNYALPPRGVAFGKPDPGMRNHDCRIDGHSFDDGLCIYCYARIDDDEDAENV